MLGNQEKNKSNRLLWEWAEQRGKLQVKGQQENWGFRDGFVGSPFRVTRDRCYDRDFRRFSAKKLAFYQKPML
jgi:hypothetical protein